MTENIVTGKKYRVLADAANKVWNRISIWSKASDTEFNDGKTAETKLGAINGITSDVNCEDETVAASAAMVNQLNSKLKTGMISDEYVDISSYTSSNPYVAEFDGYLYVACTGSFVQAIDTTNGIIVASTASSSGNTAGAILPVKKGHSCYCTSSNNGSKKRFYMME